MIGKRRDERFAPVPILRSVQWSLWYGASIGLSACVARSTREGQSGTDRTAFGADLAFTPQLRDPPASQKGIWLKPHRLDMRSICIPLSTD